MLTLMEIFVPKYCFKSPQGRRKPLVRGWGLSSPYSPFPLPQSGCRVLTGGLQWSRVTPLIEIVREGSDSQGKMRVVLWAVSSFLRNPFPMKRQTLPSNAALLLTIPNHKISPSCLIWRLQPNLKNFVSLLSNLLCLTACQSVSHGFTPS